MKSPSAGMTGLASEFRDRFPGSPVVHDFGPPISDDDCVRVNREHFNREYRSRDVETLIGQARDIRNFYHLIGVHTCYHGMYSDGFHRRLAGRTVVEFGFGDGLNALFMARLGGRVCAVEISEVAAQKLRNAAGRLGLKMDVVCGDFRDLDLPEADIVVGQAFLHHLSHQLEAEFLDRVSRLLHRRSGVARFVEPAVNWALLDRIRWLVPVPGRPSSLDREAFRQWRASDPHPVRDNSARHYLAAGAKYFSGVRATPVGGLERFRRLIHDDCLNHQFAAWSLAWERRWLPLWLRRRIARSQVLTFAHPKVR